VRVNGPDHVKPLAAPRAVKKASKVSGRGRYSLLPVGEMCYSDETMTKIKALSLFILMLSGCAPTGVSPGVTFLTGLNSYQVEMRSLEARPERWPERQRLAESIKSAHMATLGGSREFNHLVDLDLRRREFNIALHDPRLSPARAKEIREELIQINSDIDGLTRIVKGQVANRQLASVEGSQTVETVAAVGLLNLSIENFSSTARQSSGSAPVTRVGPYSVIDEGYFTTVRTPEGKVFRCSTIMVQEEGAGMRCEPVGG